MLSKPLSPINLVRKELHFNVLVILIFVLCSCNQTTSGPSTNSDSSDSENLHVANDAAHKTTAAAFASIKDSLKFLLLKKSTFNTLIDRDTSKIEQISFQFALEDVVSGSLTLAGYKQKNKKF